MFDGWVVQHGERPTNRGTMRQKVYMMYVIVVRFGQDVSAAQSELQRLINLVTRTRPRKDERPDSGQFAVGSEQTRMIKDGAAIVQAYGAYVLRLSDSDVETSQWMLWNNKPIEEETLKQLLAFDLDPDTLKPLEAQTMHKPRLKESTLFDIGAHDLDDD